MENAIVLNEQSNNVLIPEASFFLVKDAEFEKNDEENVELEQEITKKKKCKGKQKVKKEKDMEVNWSKDLHPIKNKQMLIWKLKLSNVFRNIICLLMFF